MEAALALFSKKGFERTSVREIVELAHVAKGTFYVHFETKVDVLHALAEYIMALFRSSLIQLNEAPPSLDDISRLLDHLADLMKRHAGITAMLHQFENQTVIAPDTMAFMEQWLVQPVETWLERAMADGVIREVPTGLYARLLTKTGHDLLESAFLNGYPGTLEEITAELKLLFRGMLHPCGFMDHSSAGGRDCSEN